MAGNGGQWTLVKVDDHRPRRTGDAGQRGSLRSQSSAPISAIKIGLVTVFLTPLLAGLTACGAASTSHRSTAVHPAVTRSSGGGSSAPINSALAADAAICRIWNANIGDGGESVISQALLRYGTSISYKLRHNIAEALTAGSLKADMRYQIKVTLDCAEVKDGAVPNV